MLHFRVFLATLENAHLQPDHLYGGLCHAQKLDNL